MLFHRAVRRVRITHALMLTAVILVTSGVIAPMAQAADPRTLTEMRHRHVQDLIGTIPGRDDVGDLSAALSRVTADGQSAWSTISLRAPANGELWTDVVTKGSSRNLLTAYRRVVAMALAVKTPGSALFGDAALLNDTVSAAEWLNANRYNTATARDSGWWFWQIGIPMELNDLTALLYDDLSAAQRGRYMSAIAKFAPIVTDTGANRVWAAYVMALRGVISGQSAKVSEAMTGVLPALETVTSGDGFHADGSFVQHDRFAYSGGYGSSILDIMSRLTYLVDGSQWDVIGTPAASIYDRVESTYAPVTWCGSVMSNVRGRAIARQNESDTSRGMGVQSFAMRLAESAEAAQRTMILQRAKQWVQCSSGENTLENFGAVSDIVRARLLLRDNTVTPAAGGAGGSVALNGMDRFVHSTSDFGFSVAMSSSRIGSFETISQENVSGWYTGTGATSLYLGAGRQFDDYWVTANPYRMPGTTEDTMKRIAGKGTGYKSPEKFVGGLATPNGAAGVAAMSYDAFDNALTAHKTWFTFDDEIVAVGTDIRSSGMSGVGWDAASRRIETVIDNRKALSGDARLVVDGIGVASGQTMSKTASWAAVTGSEESVGYVFPGGMALSASDETRTATWSTINGATGTDIPVTARHLVMTTSHGRNPAGAAYAYVVLPNADAAATAAYSANPGVKILAQTADHIAVHHPASATTSAVSFVGGVERALTVDATTLATWRGAGIVTVATTSASVSVTAADPTRVSTTPIVVTLPGSEWEVPSGLDPSVSVRQTDAGLVLTFATAEVDGRSVSASIPVKKTAPTATPVPTPEPGVDGVTTRTVIDSAAPAVGLSGTWSTTSSTRDVGGSVVYASVKNSSASLSFTGTRIAIEGRRTSSSGLAEVRVDGELVGEFDAYASTSQYRSVLFTSPTLARGPHTVVVTAKGSKGTASTGRNIVLDSFVIEDSAPVPTPPAEPTPSPTPSPSPTPTPRLVDSESTEIGFTGDWLRTSSSKDTAGSVRYSAVKGSSARFVFIGTSFTIEGRRTSTSGIAEVNIDGVVVGELDGYAPETLYRASLFASGPLPPGEHTVTITVTAAKSAASGGRNVILDDVIVSETLPPPAS